MKAKQKDCGSILILHRSILLERCCFFESFLSLLDRSHLTGL